MGIGAEDGVLAVTLVDRDGVPLGGLAVTAAAGRPSTTQYDRHLDLVEDTGGYRASEALAPGLWEVAVEAREEGRLVFAGRERIHVSAGAE
jgi:nitrogen fixation protein FixH